MLTLYRNAMYDAKNYMDRLPLYTTWWRFDSYRMVNNRICPALGASLEAYDPWAEFYTYKRPYRTVDAAWGQLIETIRRIGTLTDRSFLQPRYRRWTRDPDDVGLEP